MSVASLNYWGLIYCCLCEGVCFAMGKVHCSTISRLGKFVRNERDPRFTLLKSVVNFAKVIVFRLCAVRKYPALSSLCIIRFQVRENLVIEDSDLNHNATPNLTKKIVYTKPKTVHLAPKIESTVSNTVKPKPYDHCYMLFIYYPPLRKKQKQLYVICGSF